jgi:hypothetical protein
MTGNATMRITNTGLFELYTGGASDALRLSIASTGAATFSGSTLTLGTSGTLPTIKAGGANTDLQIEAVGSGGYLNLVTNGTSRIFIAAAGNVGIGTSSPHTLLTISGAASTVYGINLGTQTPNWPSVSRYIGIGNSDGRIVANSGFSGIEFGGPDSADEGYLAFHTHDNGVSSGEKMRITKAGSVGIGMTNPSYLLQLNSDSAAKPTSALWTIASDKRIKENINPYKKGLKELLDINPITYDYNGLGGFTKGKGGVGIIAQEIIDILPDSVSSIKAKLNETDNEETDILNFNGHELIYVLINAIKEQQEQIEELKAKIK